MAILQRLFFTVFISQLVLYSSLSAQLPGQEVISFPTSGKIPYPVLLDSIDNYYFVSYQQQLIPAKKSLFIRAGTYTPLDLIAMLCKKENLNFSLQADQLFITPGPGETAGKAAPTSYVVQGTLKNASNGEAVIGGTIQTEDGRGVVSNGYGFYSLILGPGNHKLTVSHTSYKQKELQINLKKNIRLVIPLEEKVDKLPDLVIQGRHPKENLTGVIPGTNTIRFKGMEEIPYFLGEVDVLQSSILLPGISSLGENTNGVNVRGGTTSQNLILLDEAPILNTNHLFGLISVFNPESVNDIEIYKGNIPARYGGRNASVISIRQREGNSQQFNVAGGIGFAATRLTVEGPLVKEKASFLVSGRRSFTDVNSLVSNDLNSSNFTDLNFKLNYQANAKNKIYLSGYYGDDRSTDGIDIFRSWGNRTLSFRWNRIVNQQLFVNTSAVFSEYAYRISDSREAGSFTGTSRIFNYEIKSDFSYYKNTNKLINFGLGTTLTVSNPGDRLPLDENGSTIPLELDTEVAVLPFLYAENEGKINRFSYNLGIRATSLLNTGQERVFIYEDDIRTADNITDTLEFAKNSISSSYFGLEPRAFLQYSLSPASAVKASYSRTYQYLHLISNTLAPSPTDIWKLSDYHIQPTIAAQYNLGYYRNFRVEQGKSVLEASAEVYYRKARNVIEYKDNADLILNENIETEILSGISRAYGLELFLKKNYGRLYGWLSYTLSKSEIQVDNDNPELNINSGEFFPANFDQTHQFSATGIYRLNKRISLSTNFVLATGKPTTLPAAKYELDGILVAHFTERNKDRLPTYHRLDLSLKLLGKEDKVKKNGKTKKKKDYWTFSVYNVYSRDNVFSYLFRRSITDNNITEVVPFSIIRSAIPSVTYNFRL